MRIKKIYIAIALQLSFLISSCMANKAQMGGIGGAAAGAIAGQAIGKNTEATLIGAAVGGMFGYMIGNEMDKYDLLAIRNTLEYNRTNEPSIWASRNPRIQTIEAIPVRTYGHCRDISLNVKKSNNMFVTEQRKACRDIYGHWKFDNGYTI